MFNLNYNLRNTNANYKEIPFTPARLEEITPDGAKWGSYTLLQGV